MASTLLGYELRIDALPYDVVVQVLVLLDIPDLLSVSLVNRALCDITSSPILWRKMALSLLSQSRPLPLSTFPSISPSKLPLSTLRTSILRSHRLLANWTSKNPLPVGPIKQSQINLSSPEAVVKMWRIGERWIICATDCGSVVVWDLRGGGEGEEGFEGCEAARCELGHGWIVFNCRIDYKRALCGVLPGSILKQNNMTITLLQIVFLPSSSTDATSTQDITFTPLHTFMLPSSHVLDLFILDHHAQLLCVLFCIRETNHIGMYMLCGWGSGEDGRKSEGQWSVLVDMGASHDHQKVNTTTLSQDKTHIILYTETYEYEERVAYEVRALWDLAHEGREPMYGNAVNQRRNEGLEMQIKKAPEAVWRSRVNWTDSDGWQRDGPGDADVTIPDHQTQTGVDDFVAASSVADPDVYANELTMVSMSITPIIPIIADANADPVDGLSTSNHLPTLLLLPSLSLPLESSSHPPSPHSFTSNSSTTPLTPTSALHARRQSRSPLTPTPMSLNLSPLIDNTYGMDGGDLYGFEEVGESSDREREGNMSMSFSFVPASAPALENHTFAGGDVAESDLDSRSSSSTSMLLPGPTLPTSTSPTLPHSSEGRTLNPNSTFYPYRDTLLDMPRTISSSTLGRLSITVPQTAPLYTGFEPAGNDIVTDVDAYLNGNARMNVVSRPHVYGHRRTDSMPTPVPIPTSSRLRMGRHSFSNRGRRIHGRSHGRTQSETLIGVVPEAEGPCLTQFVHSTTRGSDSRNLESDGSFSHTSGSWDSSMELESSQSFQLPTLSVASTSSIVIQEPELEDAPTPLTANSLLTLTDVDASLDLMLNLSEDLNSIGDAGTTEVDDVDPLQDLQNAQDPHLIPMGAYFLREWWPSWEPESDSKCTHTFKFDDDTLDNESAWKRGRGCAKGGRKDKSSHIMIYSAPGTDIWRIVQSFEDAVDIDVNTTTSPSSSFLTSPDTSSHSPSRLRFAQTIKHPVLVPNEIDMFIQPLLDVDFSHAVWVEWVGVRVRVRNSQPSSSRQDRNVYGTAGDWLDEDVDWEDEAEDTEVEEELEEVPLETVGHRVDATDGSMVKVQRRLRIMTFPTHFDSPCSRSSTLSVHLPNNQSTLPISTMSGTKAPSDAYIRTLNIPQRILVHTTRLVLDQSAGAVLLCAPSGEMWEVKYS